LRELICLMVFIIISAILSIASLVLGFVCQYKKKSTLKESTYECGVTPIGDAKEKFDIRYFNYAILFLVFDAATIFLYPFAVAENFLGLFTILAVIIFLSILSLGLYFVIKKKFLRWL